MAKRYPLRSMSLLLALGVLGCDVDGEHGDAGASDASAGGKADQPRDTDASETDGTDDTGDTEAGEDAVALPFEVVVSGRYSGWRIDTEFGIVSQAGLDFYWQQHEQTVVQQPEKPEIDFDTDMLVGLIRQYSPYTGRKMDVRAVLESEDEVHVDVLVTRAGFGCTERIDKIQLHRIIAMPRVDKPIRVSVYEVMGPACTTLPNWPIGEMLYDEYVVEPEAFLSDTVQTLDGRDGR